MTTVIERADQSDLREGVCPFNLGIISVHTGEKGGGVSLVFGRAIEQAVSKFRTA